MNTILLFFLLIIACLIMFNIVIDNSLKQYNDEQKQQNNDDEQEQQNNHDEQEQQNNDDEQEQQNNDDEQEQQNNDDEQEQQNNDGKEVFNISKNIYTYDDAINVCKAFGSELATYEQLQNEFLKGADWCNYGWSANKHAYYPTQQSSYTKYHSDPNMTDKCGKIGINGGYFPDTNLRFGVNCYGIKPKKTEKNTADNKTNDSDDNMVDDKQIDEYEKNKNNMNILPFNDQYWSMNETTSRNFINDI